MKFKQVIFIDSVEFVCNMARLVLQEEDIACYTITDLKDPSLSLSYLIEDLQSDCIIFDLKTVSAFQEDFFSIIKEVSKDRPITLWGMGLPEDKVLISSKNLIFSDFLEKPLSPIYLRDKITMS